MAEPEDPVKVRLRRKAQSILEVPEQHGWVFRVVWAIGGAVLVLAGLAMTVLPGPAIVVVPVGLGMLAGVFAWARKLVSTSIDVGVDAERWAAALPLRIKGVAVLVGMALAGAVAYLVLR